MKMKKIIKYVALAVAVVATSCDGDFDKINTDPTKSSPQNFDANYFLSSSQWNYLDGTMGYNGPILFQSGWVQLMASTSSGGANYYNNMDKYVASNNTTDYMGRSWNSCYRSSSLAQEMIDLTIDDPTKVNLTAMGRIMRILNAQYLTDVYGDVPYTEAGQAKIGNTLPVYDTQASLYPLLLSDLEAAIKSLDASKAKATADLFPYKGDVAQWKKFGYSLMLRMAMRLSKADVATAKKYAEIAYAGGTFASAADDAYILCNNANGYTNNYASSYTTAADFPQLRWSKLLIDYLKSTNDPRLGVIAEISQNGAAANQNITLAGNADPAVQLGLPNGFDLNGGATDISKAPGYPGASPKDPSIKDDNGKETDSDAPVGRYSRPKVSIYGNRDAPVFVLTYAQTELLLAEAAFRGFSVGSSAAAHYNNAVVGAMLSLTPYGAGAVITSTDAIAYATAHPLVAGSELKMINEQYWATSGTHFNFVDAWNNWKRSDYPKLTPVVYAANFSGGTIPRRQPYPTTESTLNGVNNRVAVGSLTGGDTWVARTWWDK